MGYLILPQVFHKLYANLGQKPIKDRMNKTYLGNKALALFYSLSKSHLPTGMYSILVGFFRFTHEAAMPTCNWSLRPPLILKNTYILNFRALVFFALVYLPFFLMSLTQCD